ncbi:hypothetical protein FDP41_012014 [Naegleria fowleri]|uniref:ABC transporter domain-containing protein n=1 Tax=Naegleria fowleri TaxID=5763 RepID=A0A6A5BVQ8_NAEFO|nr:uncharacterized protein FDP41_012014 [Naegleria fowleri]KAF0982153.1 hypothetical protein FDP41_012014 [Naegleria fowleri]CAG4717740.1 unnamed protein product [Naegleria fowleri]
MVTLHSKPTLTEALKDTMFGITELVQAISGKHLNARNIKYASISSILGIAGIIGLAKYWKFKRNLNKQIDKDSKGRKSIKANIDMQFLNRLKLLISIVVPSIKSKEFLQLIAVTVVVIMRTFVSNWLSSLSGELSGALMNFDFKSFMAILGYTTLLSFTSALLAPSLKFLINKLQLEWRISLTKYIHSKYLRNMMYYKTANLNTGLNDPDQTITQDVDKFCEGICGLYANLVKPIADVIVYTYQFVNIVGVGGPLVVLGYMTFSFIAMAILRPPFGTLTSKMQDLESKFRHTHYRTATNGESIAFYAGDQLERNVSDEAFWNLFNHKRLLIRAKWLFGFFNDFFVFNFPQAVSWLIAMYPVFFGMLKNADQIELARVLRYLAAVVSHEFTAVGEIIHLHTRLSETSGYAANICHLLETIDTIEKVDKEKKANTMVAGETIKFDKVHLSTPDGHTLVKNLSFEVLKTTPEKRNNVLITGPNGTGKSSIFRVLAGLWYADSGKIQKPGGAENTKTSDIYYIPQKPYNIYGTLREQIIYPDDPNSEKSKQFTNDQLKDFLRRVRIAYIADREGWDKEKNWDDILSLGEQQRLAVARLLYHKPAYAILDECTSAVSTDVESHLYSECQKENITCVTISLRPALIPHHDWELSLEDEEPKLRPIHHHHQH